MDEELVLIVGSLRYSPWSVRAWQREARQASAIRPYDDYVVSLGVDPEAGLV